MRVCNPQVVPPKGWAYTQPESGMRIQGGSRKELMQKVLAHRRANSYPIGTHVEEEVEHSLCTALSEAQRAGFCCDPDLPPLVNQALSFGRSMAAVVSKAAAGGGVAAAEQEFQKRKEICHGCEFFRLRDERCSKCGCRVSAKAWLRASQCPVGKW